MPSRPRPLPLPAFSLDSALAGRGISKRRLAKISGIPLAMVFRLARPRANPTWNTLHRLARAIGCRLDDFTAEG